MLVQVALYKIQKADKTMSGEGVLHVARLSDVNNVTNVIMSVKKKIVNEARDERDGDQSEVVNGLTTESFGDGSDIGTFPVPRKNLLFK